MAVVREITLLGNSGDPVEYTVDETTAVPQGTIMKFSASNLSAAATADGDFICGYASVDKSATDGKTKLACVTHALIEMDSKAGGSMVLGKPVKIDGANTVNPADDDTILNCTEVAGLALETVGAAAEGAVLMNI